MNESNSPKWESINRFSSAPAAPAMNYATESSESSPISAVDSFCDVVARRKLQERETRTITEWILPRSLLNGMFQVTSSKLTKSEEADNMGLPMSPSSDVLATKMAEGELQRRVESLQAELCSATAALESLQKSGEAPAGQDAGELTMRPLTTGSIAPPPGKKGYLFKWLDRSIGVSFVY